MRVKLQLRSKQQTDNKSLRNQVKDLRKTVSHLLNGNLQINKHFKQTQQNQKRIRKFLQDQILIRYRKKNIELVQYNDSLKRKLCCLRTKLQQALKQKSKLQKQLISIYQLQARLKQRLIIKQDFSVQTVNSYHQQQVLSQTCITLIKQHHFQRNNSSSIIKFKSMIQKIGPQLKQILLSIRYQCALQGITKQDFISKFGNFKKKQQFLLNGKLSFNLNQDDLVKLSKYIFQKQQTISQQDLNQKLKFIVGNINHFYNKQLKSFQKFRNQWKQTLQLLQRISNNLQIQDLLQLCSEIKGRQKDYLKLVYYLSPNRHDISQFIEDFNSFKFNPRLS